MAKIPAKMTKLQIKRIRKAVRNTLHSRSCNILSPCDGCNLIPQHAYAGSWDGDCDICGFSIYMPCHDAMVLEESPQDVIEDVINDIVG